MGLLLSLRIGGIIVKVIRGGGRCPATAPSCPFPLLRQLTFSLPSGALASLVLEPNADGFSRNLNGHRRGMNLVAIDPVSQKVIVAQAYDHWGKVNKKDAKNFLYTL